ncbi:MAG: hypothetical protein N3A58_07590 [Spirochaetes bacterium]|nr:hypothetical protein [Spirochaetota bacterium]
MKKYFLFIFLFIMVLFFSSNFSNISYSDRIKLAVAYYKVSQYYFSVGDQKKGNDFLQVAKYLDPVNYNKPLPQKDVLKKYTKQDFINIILKVKENIEKFNNKELGNYISYPCYKITNNFEILEKEDFNKTLEFVFNKYSNLFSDKEDNFSILNYNELSEKYNFIPLIYQEDDIFVFIKKENNTLLFILRGFGPNYKIVGINF